MKSTFDAVALFLTAGFVFAPGLGAQVSKPPVFDAHVHLVEFTSGGNWIESQRAADSIAGVLERAGVRGSIGFASTFDIVDWRLPHAAPPFGRELTLLMLRYPNVYADISGILFMMGMGPLKTLAEGYFAELAPVHSQLLFGSDNPYMLQNALEFRDQVSAFSEDQKRDILYNNAARLFRLEAGSR